MKRRKVLLVTLAALITTISNGQSALDRIKELGKLYVIEMPGINESKPIPGQNYLYVVNTENVSAPSWNELANIYIDAGEWGVVKDSDGVQQGTLYRFGGMNNEFISKMNENFLSMITEYLPEDVVVQKITTTEEIADQRFFLVEIVSNPYKAKNQWVIQKTGSGSGTLFFCYNNYRVKLEEKSPESNRVKELFSRDYKPKYSSIKVEGNPEEREELYQIRKKMEPLLIDAAQNGFDDFKIKSSKKISKVLNK